MKNPLQVKGPVLVVAPHPDDEIGCAALLTRLCREGYDVHYCYFSTCRQSTEALGKPAEQLLEENRNSLRMIGIPEENCHGFDFPVRYFPQHRQEILETLVKLRQELRPGLLLVPNSYDIHQDHATISAEAVRAFKHSSILGYELPWNTLEFKNDCLVPITREELEIKLGALECYASQESRIYANRRFFESLANIRGVQIGSENAECFEVIRLVLTN